MSLFGSLTMFYWVTNVFFIYSGNHTVAIIKGHESYELLQKSCSKVLSQVNKLVESKKITMDGKDIPVEVYVGGDYKVMKYCRIRE